MSVNTSWRSMGTSTKRRLMGRRKIGLHFFSPSRLSPRTRYRQLQLRMSDWGQGSDTIVTKGALKPAVEGELEKNAPCTPNIIKYKAEFNKNTYFDSDKIETNPSLRIFSPHKFITIKSSTFSSYHQPNLFVKFPCSLFLFFEISLFFRLFVCFFDCPSQFKREFTIENKMKLLET